jgi:RNA polymerase sigma factor (sigma-70 family)
MPPPTDSSDSVDSSTDLLRRWQEDGDTEALNQLLKNEVVILKHMIHGRRVAGLTGSASTSDIAQEAVLGLLKTKKPPSFSEPGALRGYLWRSAWHLLARRFTKHSGGPIRFDLGDQRVVDRFLRDAPGLEHIDREERAMAIGVAINLLSREDAELLRHVYFEDRDLATAGAALGITRDAANMRLVRARRALAARLADWEDLIG